MKNQSSKKVGHLSSMINTESTVGDKESIGDSNNGSMSTAVDDKNKQYSGEITSSKKECTSCEQNYVNNIIEDFNSVAIQDDMSMCASCGKEGNSDDMNTCNKCQSVKYCNAACKKKHRSKHKKA